MGLRELLCNCFIILWLLTGGNGRGSKGKGGHRSHVRGARGTRAPSKATSHDPWSSGPPASFFSSIIYQQTLKSNLTHRFSSAPSKLLHLSWWSLPSPKDDPPKRKISGILDTSIVISGFFKRKDHVWGPWKLVCVVPNMVSITPKFTALYTFQGRLSSMDIDQLLTDTFNLKPN